MLSSKLSRIWPTNKASRNLSSRIEMGVIYHNANWIAGVDYDNDKDIKNGDGQYSDTKDDKIGDPLEQYDEIQDQLEQIDPEEIDNIIQDARQNINPNVHEHNNNAREQQLDQPIERQETFE
jgi:hypothetical protein